jgi:hypothetical protein
MPWVRDDATGLGCVTGLDQTDADFRIGAPHREISNDTTWLAATFHDYLEIEANGYGDSEVPVVFCHFGSS